MTQNIYEKFDKAFPTIRAWAITRDNQQVGKIVVKGKTAFVHYFGRYMQFGTATGGGYDLTSAAISIGAQKMEKSRIANAIEDPIWELYNQILIDADNGSSWETALIKNGFNVFNVI